MSKPLSRSDWELTLIKLGQGLIADNATATIVIFGSVPNILKGQIGRTTIDMDIWRPASKFDGGQMARATVFAGMLYDPKNVVEPEIPYI